MGIVRLIVRIAIFVILLVLAINNMQLADFNLLGIYQLKLPLIILTGIFALGGFFFGSLLCLINNLHLKAQINKLKKQLAKQELIDKNDQLL